MPNIGRTPTVRICPDCNGTGVERVLMQDNDVREHPCGHCNGKGSIPAGTSGDASQLRERVRAVVQRVTSQQFRYFGVDTLTDAVLAELGSHDCMEATQEFRLQNDREWRDKLDHLKAENAKLRRDLSRYGAAITEAADGSQDEGDRVYFASTNTLDRLRDLRQEFFERRYLGGDLDG